MRAPNVSGMARVLCESDRNFKERKKRPTEKCLVMSSQGDFPFHSRLRVVHFRDLNIHLHFCKAAV